MLECKQLYADVHYHGEALHQMSALHASCSQWPALHSFFSVLQYTFDVILKFCCMNITISTPFLSQKTVTISFLTDVCLNFISLFGECMCNHYFFTLWFQHSQMKPGFVTYYLYDVTEKFTAIFVVLL
jgi:hypothetical protein